MYQFVVIWHWWVACVVAIWSLVNGFSLDAIFHGATARYITINLIISQETCHGKYLSISSGVKGI
jgi:hypothetical protein